MLHTWHLHITVPREAWSVFKAVAMLALSDVGLHLLIEANTGEGEGWVISTIV